MNPITILRRFVGLVLAIPLFILLFVVYLVGWLLSFPAAWWMRAVLWCWDMEDVYLENQQR